MSFDLIIKNGTVILENEARVIDIAVQGGKNRRDWREPGGSEKCAGCDGIDRFAGHG
ncbi:Allantoinase [Salmonella sp. NCTC 11881]|nr:Allantoinase [Salmonella sp. NCTC 11881]